jgi:2-polyprenyl-3-methyl-5-hydroxy-6-metoxy-1,4-benzoquinol methylase
VVGRLAVSPPYGQSGSLRGLELVPSKWRYHVPPALIRVLRKRTPLGGCTTLRKGIFMAIRIDPENNETPALFDMLNFSGQRVLEIGCGNGRVTWRYADKAAHVTGIDPDTKQIALAREQLPSQLQDRIEFHSIAFEDFASASEASAFDIVILARSLC